MIITREQCFTRELCQIRKEAALSELRHVLLFCIQKIGVSQLTPIFVIRVI